jgi:hypothetical protein
MSARTRIVEALVTKLKSVSTDNGYNSDLGESVTSRHKFWDEVNQFPTVCVVGGQEEREYLPAGFVWGHYSVSLKLYVKNGDDPQPSLENLITDVEKVINDSLRLEYDTGRQTADMKIKHIVTDEGLLAPYGVGEVNISVQYQVL